MRKYWGLISRCRISKLESRGITGIIFYRGEESDFMKGAYRIGAGGVLAAWIAGSLAGTAFAASSLSKPGQDIRDQAPQAEVSMEDNLPVKGATEEEVKFTITNFRLEALELDLNKKELTKILQDGMGAGKTLANLNATIHALTVYARQHGYPAAAAYLPSQQSRDGMVLIKLIPGHIGDVRLENHSKLKDDIAMGFVKQLKAGDIVRTKQLETTLYTLSDASGTRAVAVLSPGKEFGASDITVRIEDGKGENTILYAENYGGQATGRYRYGLQHSLYDIDGTGARMQVGGMISNQDLHNYYINYETLVGRGGTTLGLGYSRMDYHLGGKFRDWRAYGRADTISVFGQRPVYHQSDRALMVKYGYDYRKLKDDIGKFAGAADSDKQSHSVHVGVEGSVRSGSFMTEYTATLTTGTISMDSSYAKRLGAVGGTDGAYTKMEASAKLVQAVGHRSDLSLKLAGQLASHALDSSEQFTLGGANGVRAYPQSEGSGDMGYLATLEARYYTDVPGLVASTYFDMGHASYKSFQSEGMTLKGYGIGLSYSKPNDWFARLDYARRIGGDENLSQAAKAKGRVWFMLGKIW